MRIINVSLIVTLVAAAAQAQQGHAISFGPIPGIVAGTTVPPDSTQFVFMGPNIRQLTISYPSALVGGSSTNRITFTVQKLDQVIPVISSSVTPVGEGVYNYKYSIANDRSALAAVKVWSLSLPASDAVITASHSSWAPSQEATTAAVTPLPGMVASTPVAFTSFHAPANGAIAPNSTVSGFQVTSSYRPGLTLLYARSDEDYALPAAIPVQVNSQLDVMRWRDWMNKRVMGIGPRFPGDWTRDVVAADFKDGIARLTQTGDLDASSPFVSLLNATLDTLISSQGTAVPLTGVTALAGSQLEKNIANAISISLQ